jgi:tetratricopeptide (TPR) repeat protein
MSADPLLYEAAALHQAGQLKAAEARYREVLERSPENAVALHNLGMVAVQEGNVLRAVPYFERALKAAPDDVNCWRSTANCKYLMGLWEEALALIQQAEARGIKDDGLAAIARSMRGEPGGKKVFCVGRNKTGTTSLEAALQSLGLRMGLQTRGEMLKSDWARRDFTRILELCRTADAFQDVPFSLPFTFQALDMGFPGSKFILTVRDSPEQWFESVKRFHTRIVNKGRLPTADDLREFVYHYKGYLWEAFVLNYGGDESHLYDKDIYIAHYLHHNRAVTEYFMHRSDDLLVLNVGEPDAMKKLCAFLGLPYRGQVMPRLNVSR